MIKKKDFNQLKAEINQLKEHNDFGAARQYIESNVQQLLKGTKEYIELMQLLALCTYKDPDLSPFSCLDAAFEILVQADPPQKSTNQETLGLAGAIYKRKWQFANRKQDLERSLYYYRKGHDQNKTNNWADGGYTAINAAFVLDFLGFQELHEADQVGDCDHSAQEYFDQANKIRQEIVDSVCKLFKQPDYAKKH
ncbi:MAG: hypothetical protein JRG71_16360, partial [Deltaproteobacteria bacterium]|nr:hypothetical protein [Deltaproteobacteria bacterium]